MKELWLWISNLTQRCKVSIFILRGLAKSVATWWRDTNIAPSSLELRRAALKVRWLLGNTSFLSTALFYKSQAPQVFGSIAEVLPAGKKWGWQHQWRPAENSHLQNFIFMDKETVNAIPTQLVFRDFLNAELNRLNSTRVFSERLSVLLQAQMKEWAAAVTRTPQFSRNITS